MNVTVAGTRIALRPLWRAFVISMLTGSLYQAWWLFEVSEELAALGGRRALSVIERCLWPVLIIGGEAGMLWLVMRGASFGEWRWVGACTFGLIVCGAVHHIAQQVATAEREVGVHRSSADRSFAALSMAFGLVVGGAQALPNGAGHVDFVGLLLAGVVPPCWLLIVQYRLNRVLERMDLTSDDAVNWNYGKTDVVSLAVRARITAHRRRQEADAQLDLVPWVSIALAAVCTLAFAWQLMSFGLHFSERDLRNSGAMSLDLVRQGQGWRLLTMHIMHVSVGHWAGNMFALSLTGWMVERTVGHRAMFAVIVSGMATSTLFAWLLTVPLYGPRSSAMLSLGESGIGFAVIGAMWGLDMRCHSPIGKFGRAMTIMCGVSSLAPGVGILAHAGGFCGGFGMAYLIARQQGLDFTPRVIPITQVVADVQRMLAAAAAATPPATVAPPFSPPAPVAPPALPSVVPPPKAA